MKKRYLTAFFTIIVINLSFRLIIPEEISDVRAVIIAVFIVVLPYVYAFGAFGFTSLSWKTVGITSSAVLISGILMTFFGNRNPPLDELGWVYMQLPSLALSLAAGYFTFSAKTRHKKLKTLGSTVPPLILAFICVYYFCSFIMNWAILAI